jgi:hypothetical protein
MITTSSTSEGGTVLLADGKSRPLTDKGSLLFLTFLPDAAPERMRILEAISSPDAP